MCLNCGCGKPNDRHGNDANIVADDVQRAADANGQDLATAARNMTTSLGDLDDRAGRKTGWSAPSSMVGAGSASMGDRPADR